MVAMGRVAARGDDFEAVGRLLVGRGAGPHQDGAGVDLRALEQSVERDVGERDDVARLGELEGEAAEIGGGAADLGERDVGLFVLGRLGEEAALLAAMRDRRGLVGFEDAFGVDLVGGAAIGFAVVDGLGAAEQCVRIREGLREVVDEGELRVADADDVAGLQCVVGLEPLAVDQRAVAAIEIAERPLALRLEDFGVVTAAALVFADDGIGGRTTDRNRLAIDEPKDVGPFGPFANNQVRSH